jgi:hypothetical protein
MFAAHADASARGVCLSLKRLVRVLPLSCSFSCWLVSGTLFLEPISTLHGIFSEEGPGHGIL